MDRSLEQYISPGDVVYCIAGEREKPLSVEKATVDSDIRDSGPDSLPYHYLIVWDDVNEDPNGEGATITKLPWELFTEQEVESLLNGSRLDMPRNVDGLVASPLANHNLAGVIGGAVIERMLDTPQRLVEAHERTIALQ